MCQASLMAGTSNAGSRQSAMAAGLDGDIERLMCPAKQLDPIVEDIGRRLGVGRGWRTLEIGPGTGGMSAAFTAWGVNASTCDARAILEPDDTVVADESELFDFVHSRYVLASASQQAEALGRLQAVLRPGGWLVVAEPLRSRVEAYCDELTQALRFSHRVMKQFFGFDADTGWRLPTLFEDAGLRRKFIWPVMPPVVGGGPWAAYLSAVIAAATPYMTASERNISTVARRVLADPSFMDLSDAITVACGQLQS